MYHHRQIACDFLGTLEGVEIGRPDDVERQPRLHADNRVAVALDRRARQSDVCTLHVIQLAVGRNAGAREVDEDTAAIRRRLRIRHDVVDLVRPCGSGIDKTRHTVGKADRRHLSRARGVSVHVDQARHDELSSRVERLRTIRRDVAFDRGDAPADDRNVAHCVDPRGGIDDATALDDQVVGGGECARDACKHRGARGRRKNKLTSGRHG